ncbi:MAG: twin-arginine translocase TatA/TatE family subunit [Balneolaceae bacterium]|nr:MAG: twin-arginine translocase TatA/TatE family subunit [Balneolaceae bacterium]
MGSFGGVEILVIVLVVLLLFGAKKIPELARGLGQGITEFRKASTDIRKELEKGSEEPVEPRREEKKREEQKVKKEENQD